MKIPMIVVAAVAVLPSAVFAQNRELRQDRQQIREAERDLDRAQRYGEYRHVRQARDNLRDAHDQYEDDWQRYRARNRQVYARGDWRAPFRYQRFATGGRLRPSYYASRYTIADYRRFHLPIPPRSSSWIRHYDDVILVDLRSGRVLDVIHGFFW